MGGHAFDLAVIGGGITGACIARDAALRGLSVALLEKGDFGHATTAASSKLIHGGLRYLRYLQFGVVRDSLRERRVWANTAPHMLEPVTFIMPFSRARRRQLLEMHAVLTAYDLLAFDRNRLHDAAKIIPRHLKLSREEAIALEPGLAPLDLDGAMTFTDYQMYSPERLALECVLDATARGGMAANYAEVKQVLVENRRAQGLLVRDLLDAGREQEIRARLIVNASGPWADIFMGEIEGGGRHPRRLIRSKGIHLVTRPLTDRHGVAVLTRKAHFFIVPWRGHSLIGTTDTVFKGDPDACGVTEEDIHSFLTLVNGAYPAAQLTRADVLHAYAGLRPIVDVEAKSVKQAAGPEGTYRASRAAEVYDHETQDGIAGAITAIGGKWTTSRSLAAKVVDLAARKLGRTLLPCTTDTTPTCGGTTGPFVAFVERTIQAHAGESPVVLRHLARNYGSRLEEVLRIAHERPEFSARLHPTQPDIAAQVVHAVRHEMARTLEDVIFRRTGLGTLGSPGDATLSQVAGLMGEMLGWDDAEVLEQQRRVARRFQTSSATDENASGA
jgi:glycerol-3-phosphate dehydrogenase